MLVTRYEGLSSLYKQDGKTRCFSNER